MATPNPHNEVIDERTLGVTSIFQKTHEHAVIDHEADADERILVSLGYRQEFKRDFSLWSCFSVSFSVLGILPSVASTLYFNFGYVGTAGAVWGWLTASVLIQFVALAMAELCSSMPTAGGLYYASAVLAPPGWGPLASWVTGWSNFTGQLTGPASIGYALAYMILTAASVMHPEYTTVQNYQVYLVLLLLFLISGLLCMQSTKFIARLNIVTTWANLVAIVIFCIWLPVGSIGDPKYNSNREVWTGDGIQNGTEWPTGFAFLMALLSTIYTMSGYDSPFHLSEECSNANIAAPRAIVMTAQLGFYLGFACILPIAYTWKLADIGTVLSSSIGQPFGALCIQVLGTNAGLALFCINMVAQFGVMIGCVVTSSRVTYAYSRDDAIPGSRWWKQVNSRTKTPVNALWFNMGVNCILCLLIFAGPVAIGAVFSIGAIAQYCAFILPLILRLTAARDTFRPGKYRPWNLGRWSKPIGTVAVGWVVVIIPILCFPSVKGGDLTAVLMNYTCVIYGGVMSLALLWFAVDARKWFKGPKINVQHMIYADDDDSNKELVKEDAVYPKTE